MSLSDNNGYPGPQGTSVAQNVQEALEYQSTHGPSSTISWFVEQVQGGGDWDYRQQGENLGLGKTAWQDIGNFNFGAVGTALGFNSYELENLGGIYQWWRDKDGSGFPFIINPYYDDQVDNDAIRAGINAAHQENIYAPEDRILNIGDLVKAVNDAITSV